MIVVPEHLLLAEKLENQRLKHSLASALRALARNNYTEARRILAAAAEDLPEGSKAA